MSQVDADAQLSRADILIIGGGVMGSACAAFLLQADPGLAVTVVEPDPTYERAATPKASGGVRQLFSLPENIRMSMFSISWFHNFHAHVAVNGEAPDLNWKQGGYLFIVPKDQPRVAQLQDQFRLQQQLGVRVEMLDPAALKRRFPSLEVGDLGAACLSPEDGWLDPNAAYYTVNAKLWDTPRTPIPLLTAANGVKSMRLAGVHGDGLITDPLTWQQHHQQWEDGARSAGKSPSNMPVLVEQYVVIGTKEQAQRPAELWRFGPKAFKTYFNDPSPVHIQQRADAEVPIDQVLQSWAVSPDPEVHIQKLRSLFDSGVSIVNVHCPMQDQRQVIEFYARNVLPHFRQPL